MIPQKQPLSQKRVRVRTRTHEVKAQKPQSQQPPKRWQVWAVALATLGVVGSTIGGAVMSFTNAPSPPPIQAQVPINLNAPAHNLVAPQGSTGFQFPPDPLPVQNPPGFQNLQPAEPAPPPKEPPPTINDLGPVQSGAYYPAANAPPRGEVFWNSNECNACHFTAQQQAQLQQATRVAAQVIFDHASNEFKEMTLAEFEEIYADWILNNGSGYDPQYATSAIRTIMVQSRASTAAIWRILSSDVIGYHWQDGEGQSWLRVVENYESPLFVSNGVEAPSWASNEFLSLNAGLPQAVCSLSLDAMIKDERKLIAVRLFPSPIGTVVRLDVPSCVEAVAFIAGHQLSWQSQPLRDKTGYFAFSRNQADVEGLLQLGPVRDFLNSSSSAHILWGQWVRVPTRWDGQALVRLSSLSIAADYPGHFAVAYVLVKGNEHKFVSFDMDLVERR